MMKMDFVCGHCEKHTLSTEVEGILYIDFSKRAIEFMCPHCNKLNLLPLGASSKKRQLPRIGMGR